MPERARFARNPRLIELHASRGTRRSRKRKPAMDTERHTAVRGDSTSSPGEAAAALSEPHAPGTSPARPLERAHDEDPNALALRADYEALARENKILREELAQRRLAATRFRRFFELPLIGISIASPDRHMLDVNQKFCDMLGYVREELVGRDWVTITHPDDVAENVRLLEQTLRSETEFYALDKRFIHRDGHLVYTRISACCVRRPDGSVDHVVLTVQDMTARHLAQQQLERTEAHLKHGQQIAQIGSYEIDMPGLVGARWSDELYHIVGLETARPAPGPEEYIECVVHPDDRSYVRDAILQRAQADHRVTLEYRIVRPDGAVRHVQSITDPVKDTAGRIVKLVGTLIDVTERKLAGEQLEARTAQLDLLFQSAAEAIVLVDLDNRVLRANTEFTRLFGYPAEEVLGRNVNDLTVPAEMMGEAAELSARLACGQLYNAESIRCRSDGSRLHVSILGAPITSGGQQIASYAIYRDITDRKRADEAQARHGRHVALRADVHAALSRTSEPLREGLQRATEAIVRHLEGVFARIWTLNEDDEVLELQASAGLHTHIDGAHSRVPVGQLEIGEIARDRAPRVCNEAFSEGRFSDPDWARRAGIITFAGFPLLVGERTVGVVAMFARHVLEPDTLEAFESIADTIAQGVERRHADEALRREVAERARAEQLARAHATLVTSTLASLRREPTAEVFVGQVLLTIIQQLGGNGGTFSLPGPQPGTAVAYMNYQNGKLVQGIEADHPSHVPQRVPHLPGWGGARRIEPEVLDWQFIQTSPDYMPFREWAYRLGVKTVLQLPLFFSADSLGICAVRFDTERTFSPEELDLAKALALQGTLAVEVARLTQQAQEAAVAQEREAQFARTNAALTRTLDSLASEASLDSALGEVLATMAQQVAAPSAAMWLYDVPAGTSRLHLLYERQRVFRGDEADHPHAGATISLRDHTLQAKLLDGRTRVVAVEPQQGFEVEICEYLHAQGVHSMLCVPMTAAGEVVGGCLVRLTDAAPPPEQIEFARVLAQQATLALLVTRMGQVQQQSALLAERERAARVRAMELDQANAALQRTVSALSAAGDLKSLMEHVLLEAAGVVDARMACILVHEPVQDTLTMSWCVLDQQPLDPMLDPRFEPWRGQMPARAARAWRKILETGRHSWFSYLEDNDDPPPISREWQIQMGHRSVLAVPLMPGDQPVGFMALTFTHDVPPEAERVEWARVFGHQASLALMLARFGEQARQAVVSAERERVAHERAAELAKTGGLLRDALRVLASQLDLDRFLEHILRATTQLLGAHSVGLVLFDWQTGRIEPHLNFYSADLTGSVQPSHDPLALALQESQDMRALQGLFEQKTPVVVPDLDEVAHYWPKRVLKVLRELGVRSVISLPLVAADHVLARFIVRFREKRLLAAEELELLHAISHQLTLALHLTRLAEQSRQSAIFAERNRFARDIHDTLAQGFTGVIIQLEAAKDAIARRRNSEADDHIQRAADLARHSLAEARRSVHALKPLALEAGGLRAAFEALLARVTAGTTVAAHFTVTGKAVALPLDWEENLLRIGQEALTNALRHANPRTFRAALLFGGGDITLTLTDDGNGFDPEAAISGMGLSGMRERAARMGWTLSLHSQAAQGTEILVQMPRRG